MVGSRVTGAGGAEFPAPRDRAWGDFLGAALADELNSLEKLRSHPRVARYVRWARKQDPGKRIRVRRGRR